MTVRGTTILFALLVCGFLAAALPAGAASLIKFHLADADVPAVVEEITVIFNPSEIAIQKVAPWKTHAVSEESPELEFTKGKPHKLGMDLIIDTSAEGTSAEEPVQELQALVHVDGGPPHRPPVVRFSWGSAGEFSCVLERLDVTYTLFRPDGVPVRAEISITLNECVADKPKAKSRR